MTVTWKTVDGADGYEIWYKTGDTAKKETVKTAKAAKDGSSEKDGNSAENTSKKQSADAAASEQSLTLADLPGGAEYKVKIRSYCKKTGDSGKLRSTWSKAKTVTIKHTKWSDLQDKYIDNKKVKQLIFVKYKGNSKAELILYTKKKVEAVGNAETAGKKDAAANAETAGKKDAVANTEATEEKDVTGNTEMTGMKDAAANTEATGKKDATVKKGATDSTADKNDSTEQPKYIWKKVLSCDAYTGQNGIDKKKEGDRRTPTGTFGLDHAFGVKKDPGSKMKYTKLKDYHYWCGDKEHYNQMIDIRDYPHSCRGEHLINYTKQYAYSVNISYNKKGVYGKGSAIFLHCYGYNPYTLGCIAVSEDNMKTILKTCGDKTKICIYKK